jgi:hypothetical protein
MSFSFSKINGTLIFNDYGGFQSRNPSTFWCIQKADEKYNFKDFNEIIIHTDDFENDVNDYTYSKHDSYNKLVPDFNFHAWTLAGIDDYEQYITEIDNAGLSSPEINKVGWIGAMSNFRRNIMLEIGNVNRNLFDFIEMSWIQVSDISHYATQYLSTPELVKKYAILIDIEGSGYSGRLKHLLWSHRPVIVVDRPHKEYFFEHLREWEHYIPVQRDLSDLIEKTIWCFENYDKALQIAENAYQFSKKYLTRDACYDKWKDIIESNYTA